MKLNQLKSNEIAQKYKDGKSFSTIQKEMLSQFNLELSITTISRHVHKAGLKTRRTGGRVYQINQDYFDNPETWGEGQCYLYGFIMGDGHNNLKNGSVKIVLAETDKEHLQKLSDLVHSKPLNFSSRENNRLKGGKAQDVYAMTICSRKISDQLSKLGVGKGKSEECHLPLFLNDDQIRHVLRGLFDADACYNVLKEGRLRFVFTGNEFICAEVLDFLKDRLGLNSGRMRKIKNVNAYSIQVAGSYNMEKLYHFLYNSSSLFLERKRDKFINYFKNPPKQKQQTYIGVYEETRYPNRMKKFTASLKVGDKRFNLGCFLTPEDAAHAADRKRIEIYGFEDAKARLNFYSHYKQIYDKPIS